MLLSDVGEDDAPTVLREGSHRDVARRLAAPGPEGLTASALAATGYVESAHRPERQAIGPIGTVYLCHPFLVHRTQSHCGRRPRFMAQQALLPRTEVPDPASPVARAISAALV